MDKEGQRANTPVFQSGNIGNKATPEYFVNVKGGKKDQAKVETKRSRISRKTLTVIFGCVIAAIIVVLTVALIANLASRPKGSRTDEVIPATMQDIESRAYKVLYSGDENGYENAIVYLNDLIKDMGDLNQSQELIFAAYAIRALIAYQAGGEEVAISEAQRLVEKAETNSERYAIYRTLLYIYNSEGNEEKCDFYSDLMDELDVPENKLTGEAGYTIDDTSEETEGTADENE